MNEQIRGDSLIVAVYNLKCTPCTATVWMTSKSVHYLAVEGGPADVDREGPLQGTVTAVILGAVLIGAALLGPHYNKFTAYTEHSGHCHNSTAYCPLCSDVL